MRMLLILLCVPLTVISASPLQEFIKGNNLLTTAIYGEIAKKYQGNILVSPLSAQLNMALMQSGAKGETAQEIRAALHLPSLKKDTELAVKTVIPSFNTAKQHKLLIANKVYVRDGLSIKPQFKRTAKVVYQSEIQNVDFSDNLKTAGVINKWIEDHTENKIQNIISEDEMNNKTITMLVSAMYFKGSWLHGFGKKSATKEKFYTKPEEFIEVDTMHAVNRILKYYEDKEVKARFVELPLNGRDLSMVIILPDSIEALSDLENKIGKAFDSQKFKYTLLDIAIPKFKIESKIELKDILVNLGVDKAFKNGEADFSGIVGQKGQLYVDSVIQKISIDVDESSAEASVTSRSASNVKGAPSSIRVDPPTQFNVDHPFLFYIKMKNMVLFGGRVSVPQLQQSLLQ